MHVIELERVVRDAGEAARASAELRRLTLALVISAAPRVCGESFLLGQAISNLVQNALEFTPNGGAVTLTLAMEDARAVVRVEDTGGGLPDFALEKIFDRFF